MAGPGGILETMPALSVVVPTYNEAENIGTLVERMTTALAHLDFEAIFVDDSTDGTEQVIAELARDWPHLRIVHRTNRGGLASAVADGIALSTGDVICVLDADLQHPPEAMRVLMDGLERTRADLAIASRYLPGGNYDFTLARRIVSRVATALAWLFVRRARSVSDPMSGFFVFRRSVVDGVHLQPVGFKILLEILVRGHVGCVVEVPYRFGARGAGKSKLTHAQNIEYLRHLLILSRVRAPTVQRITYSAGPEAIRP
jgi:dolichol-phosphate mannosyltransferase